MSSRRMCGVDQLPYWQIALLFTFCVLIRSGSAASLCPVDSSLKICDCIYNDAVDAVAVNCSSLHITSTALLHDRLLDTVINLTVSGNDLPMLGANLLGDCAYDSSQSRSSLRLLDLSNNNISNISGKTFHCMPSLHTLILDNNLIDLSNNANRMFSNLLNLRKLSMNNAFSSKGSSQLLQQLDVIFQASGLLQLTELHLDHNNIQMQPRAFCNIPVSLQILHLSYNPIRLDGALSFCAPATLYLDHNMITNLDQNAVQYLDRQGLDWLHLDGNPLSCDMVVMQSWLRSSDSDYVVDRELVCSYPSQLVGQVIIDIHPAEFVCMAPASGSHSAVVVPVILFLIFVVIAVLVVSYINRSRLKSLCNAGFLSSMRETVLGRAGYSYKSMNSTVEMEAAAV